MRRGLFTLISAASLLVCLATVVVWARSLTTISILTRASREGPSATANVIHCFGGRLRYQRAMYYYDPSVIRSHEVEAQPLEFEERVFPLQQARVLYGGGPLYSGPFDRTHVHELSVPLWAPAIVTAALPAAWVWSRVKQRRAAARSAGGLCSACGYDLRGVDHERCPECGTVKTGGAEAAA